MKLTPWFPGTVKPVRVGVYEREYRTGDVGYCYWNGQIWSWKTTTTPTDALRLQDTRSPYQNIPWRGVLK
jgi:hypothetical protein